MNKQNYRQCGTIYYIST